MKYITYALVGLAVMIPAVSLGAYVRTPSGVATSTSFTFSTNSSADMPGWGGGGSWHYVFGRINMTDPIDGGTNHGICHTTENVSETFTASDLGFATGSQVGGVQYREYSDGSCGSPSNNGVMEGANNWWSVAPTQSIFEFNSTSTTPTSTPSTFPVVNDYTSICTTQGSSTACYYPILVQLFWWLDVLFFAFLITLGLGIYKFYKL